jgi:hypothetical protein
MSSSTQKYISPLDEYLSHVNPGHIIPTDEETIALLLSNVTDRNTFNIDEM